MLDVRLVVCGTISLSCHSLALGLYKRSACVLGSKASPENPWSLIAALTCNSILYGGRKLTFRYHRRLDRDANLGRRSNDLTPVSIAAFTNEVTSLIDFKISNPTGIRIYMSYVCRMYTYFRTLLIV